MDKTQQTQQEVAAASSNIYSEFMGGLDKKYAADLETTSQDTQAPWASDYDNPLWGSIKNAFAKAAQGTTRIAGNVAGGIAGGYEAQEIQNNLSQEVREAYNLVRSEGVDRNSQEFKDAKALLNSKYDAGGKREAANPYSKYQKKQGQHSAYRRGEETNLQAINRLRKAVGDSKEAKDSVTALTKGIDNKAYTAELESAYEQLGQDFAKDLDEKGTAKAVLSAIGSFAKATALNPMEAAQLFAEQLPQFVANSNFVTAAANLGGYSNDVFMEAMQELEADGNLADADQVAQAGTAAGGAALLDTVIDKTLTSGSSITKAVGGKPLQKAVAKTQDKAVQSLNKKLGKEGTKALLDSMGLAGSVAGSSAKEAVTEGAQAILEEDVAKDHDSIDWANAATNAAYGASAGGMVDAGRLAAEGTKQAGKAVKKVTEPVTEKVKEKTAAKANEIKTKAAETDEAVQQDIDDGIRPEQSKYVLGTQEELSSVEGISKALDNAARVVDQKANADTTRKYAAAGHVALMSEVESARAQQLHMLANEGESMSAEDVHAVNEQIKTLDKTIARHGARSEAYKQQLGEQLNTLVQGLEVAPAEQVDQVVETMATAPEQVTQEQIDAVLAAEGATQAQKAQAESIGELNQINEDSQGITKVREDAINGSKPNAKKKYIGANQYKAATIAAANKGDTETAKKSLDQLKTFATRHAKKAADIKAARAKAKPKQPVTLEQYTTQQGTPLVVHANSGKLEQAVTQEAELMARMIPALEKYVSSSEQRKNETESRKPTSETESSTVEENSAATTESESSETGNTPDSDQGSEANTDSTTETESQGTEVESETDTANTPEPLAETEAKVAKEPQATQAEPEAKVEAQLETIQESETENLTNQVLKDAAGTVEAKGKTTEKPEAEQKFLTENQVQNNFTAKKASTPFQTVTGWLDNVKSVTLAQVKEWTGKDFTQEQMQGFTNLDAFAQAVKPYLMKGAKVKLGNYRKARPIQYFADAEGNIPEYVMDAITLATYNWISNSGKDTVSADESTVVNFLSLGEAHEGSKDIAALMPHVGVNRDLIIQSIGQEALSLMGLKANKDTSPNLKANLITSLGLEGLNALMDQKLVKEQKITHEMVKDTDFFEDLTSKDHILSKEKGYIPTYQITQPDAPMFKQAGHQNKALMASLESEFLKTYAKFGDEVPHVTDNFADGDGQLVPRENFGNAVKASRRNKHYVNKNMVTLARAMGTKALRTMLGYKDPESVLKVNKPSVEGKNRSIDRELETFGDFMTRMEGEGHSLYETPIRYGIKFANQMRQMIQGQDLNFQNKKFHRFMTNMEPTEVSFNDDYMMGYFIIAVGQGLGVDTDKLEPSESIPRTMKKLEAMQPALTTLMNHLEGGDLDVEAVLAAVDQGGEKTHTLKALMSWAEMSLARKQGAETFTTSVSYEIDGITNGAFNEAIQFGLHKGLNESVDALARGGLFIDKIMDFGEWKANSENLDVYELTGSMAGQSINETLDDSATTPDMAKQLRAFISMSNILEAGRKFAKAFVTPAMYGSQEAAQTKALAKWIENKFLADVEKAWQKKDSQAYKAAISNMAQIIGTKSGDIFQKKWENARWDQIQNISLDKYAKKGVFWAAKNIYVHVDKGVKANFEDIDHVATRLTAASEKAFQLYNDALTKMLEKRREEMVEAGELSQHEVLPPSEVDKIKAGLKPMALIMNTAFTPNGTDNRYMMPLHKEKGKHLKEGITQYEVESLQKGQVSRAYSAQPTLEGPGAGVTPKTNIANGDASTVGRLQASDVPFMNTHDGFTMPIHVLDKGTEAANIAAYKAVMEYDLVHEAVSMLERVQSAYQGMFPEVDTDTMTASERKGDIPLSELVTDLRQLATEIQDVKKELAAKQIHFTQFNGIAKGVTYKNGKVTNQLYTKQEMADAINLASQVNAETQPDESLDENIQKQSEATPKVNPNSEKFNQAIADIVGSKQTTYGNIRTELQAYLKEHNPILAYVLEKANRLIPENLPIKVLDSSESFIYPNGLNSADTFGGFMSIRGEPEYIYLNDNTNAASGLNPETLVHELVHAALVSVMDAAPSTQTLAVRKAKQEINKLYKEVKDLPWTDSSHYGLGDVHEFLAWGLTNKPFAKALAAEKNEAWATKITKRLFSLVKKVLGLEKRPTEVNDALSKLFSEAEVLFKYGKRRNHKTGAYAQQAREAHIDALDTVGLFDSIQEADTEHTNQIRSYLQNTVAKVMNPLFAQHPPQHQEADLQMRHFMSQLDANVNKSLNNVEVRGFNMTQKERYAFKVIRQTMEFSFTNDSNAKNQVEKIVETARKQLSWKNFMDPNVLDTDPAYGSEKNIAEMKYKMLFGQLSNLTSEDVDHSYGSGSHRVTASDVYPTFIALAITNPDVKSALDNVDFRVTKQQNEKILDRLGRLFNYALGRLFGYIQSSGSSSNANAKLKQFSADLVHTELGQKSRLQQVAEAAAYLYSLPLNLVSSSIKLAISKMKDNDSFRSGAQTWKNRAVRLADTFMDQDRVKWLMVTWDNLILKIDDGKQGFWSAIWSDFRGTNEGNQRIHRLMPEFNRDLDHARQNAISNTEYQLRSALEVTDKEDSALFHTFAKTDLTSLMQNGMSWSMLRSLISSPSVTKRKVKALETHIRATYGQNAEYYINQAQDLGYSMVTGKNGIMTMANAEAIAKLVGTGRQQPNKKVAASAEKDIDSLASLFALHYTPMKHRRVAEQVINREFTKHPDTNGITFLMGTLESTKQMSKARAFKDTDSLLFRKGYIKEELNPHVNVKIGNLEDKAAMEAAGYTHVGKLAKDDSDAVAQSMHLYINDIGGDVTYMQGLLANMTLAAKGTKQSEIAMTYTGQKNPQQVTANKQRRAQSLFQPRTFKGHKSGNMAPIINAAGDIVDWRYMMTEEFKENSILDKNTSIIEGIARTGGSTIEKQASVTQNRKLMDALAEQYAEDLANFETENYLEIHANHPDRELRDIWNMIPHDAKEYAKKKFPDGKIKVRKDLLTLAFGQRKMSIRQLWETDPEAMSATQNFMRKTLELIFGKRAHRWMAKGERALQEMVRFVKDTVVIKSVVVLIDNMISNTLELVMLGVPVKQAFMDQYKAFRAANKYRKNEKELAEIDTKLELQHYANVEERDQLLSRRVALKDQQSRNPVAPLIEEGLLQSIVEDVEQKDSRYNYRHSIESQIRDKFGLEDKKLPNIVHEIFMTSQSSTYQALNSATQLSDFASRYALYNHLSEKEGMDKGQALQESIDAFINYDLPQHKYMQYANDIGFAWFFKYFMRIQKVLYRAFRKHPERVAAILLAQDFAGDMADPYDSNILQTSPLGKLGIFDNMIRGIGAHPLGTIL